jgi:hypothetical protein
MPLTKLDTTTALIVIDLQKVMVGRPTVHPVGEVVNHAAVLADAFRRHRLPVVLVNADGGAPGRTEQAFRMHEYPAGWTDLLPELNQHPEDHIVTKSLSEYFWLPLARGVQFEGVVLPRTARRCVDGRWISVKVSPDPRGLVGTDRSGDPDLQYQL